MTGWMQREFPINSKAHWFIYIFLFFPFFENDFSILFAEHTESFFYKMWGRFLKLAQISKKKIRKSIPLSVLTNHVTITLMQTY